MSEPGYPTPHYFELCYLSSRFVGGWTVIREPFPTEAEAETRRDFLAEQGEDKAFHIARRFYK